MLFLCCFSFHAFQYVDLSYFHSLYFLLFFCFVSVSLVFLFCISYVFFVLFCFVSCSFLKQEFVWFIVHSILCCSFLFLVLFIQFGIFFFFKPITFYSYFIHFWIFCFFFHLLLYIVFWSFLFFNLESRKNIYTLNIINCKYKKRSTLNEKTKQQ